MVEEVVQIGLREIVAARAALDSLETALVVRARLTGAGWRELGALLGLTKQGARARHLAVDPIFGGRRQRPPTFREFHAELAAVLAAEARSRGERPLDA